MTILNHFLLLSLYLCILSLSNGCATLPNASEVMNEAPAGQEPRQIVSSNGLLSPE